MADLEIFDLKGKTAVVIGGTGVLGSAIAAGLAGAGAKVALCGRTSYKEKAESLAKGGREVKGYYVDVMDKDKTIACKDRIIADFKRIDILVNAAGGNIKEATTSDRLSFFDLEIEKLNQVVNLNLFGGAILPAQVFGKEMAKNSRGGSIINISSMNAFRPLTKIPGYSAAKAAVSNFTQWLAVHLAKEYNKNLRVNAIAPGFFLTSQNHYLLFDKDENLTERGRSIIAHTPMAEFGKPQNLVGVCIWLASEASRFVTGIVIPIDGGFSAYAGV
ncbi:MAG: SDR family oxidoreductase [Actinomycetota bacterium]